MNFRLAPQDRKFLLQSVEILDDDDLDKGFGLRRVKTHWSRSVVAFYHDGLGVVVKRAIYILDPRTPKHMRAPTIKLGKGWVAQPILKKTQLLEACRILTKKLNPYLKMGINPDLHTGNVGWYQISPKRRIPLLFDW